VPPPHGPSGDELGSGPRAMTPHPRVAIVGIGNLLKCDEGVGVRVVEELLTAWAFPDGVEVVDAGTSGLGMLPLFERHDLVIVVDAVDGTGLPPGSVVLLTTDDLVPGEAMHSLHDTRLPDVLAAHELAGGTAEVRVVGVQVARISEEACIGLTEGVERAVPAAVAAVLDLAAAQGVAPLPRTSPSELAERLRALRLGGGRPAGS
jgi:hydrogenase maturation protease